MLAKLKTFFSGRLVLIQLSSGVGAFALRSVAAYSTSDLDTWVIIVSAQCGSFAGYIGSYFLGYWLVFRREYEVLDRSMGKDVARLQVVEQSPNIWTIVSAAVSQAALLETTEVGSDQFNAVFSANLASWFGPHKILNLGAMLTSNSLKKAWVDNTWSPVTNVRRLWRRITPPGTGAQ